MLLVVVLFFPFIISAHPGIGIVKDSKGNIYYTDLEQVWKMENGNRSVAVPHVHTHELYMDNKDNLYGENLRYSGDRSNKYYHHLWVLQPDGGLDTLIGPVQAYVQTDFSLARDTAGNEYFIKQADSSRIFKKLPGKKELVFAEGNFAGVTWLHPQKSGSVLLIQKNTVYRIDPNGRSTVVANSIAGKNPTFKFAANNRMAWGVWQDDAENVYIAVFSDQVVKKIDSVGRISNVYRSADNWTPLQGVFDNNHQLWVLEASDKNEVRVTAANSQSVAIRHSKKLSFSAAVITAVIVLGVCGIYLIFRMEKRNRNH